MACHRKLNTFFNVYLPSFTAVKDRLFVLQTWTHFHLGEVKSTEETVISDSDQ